MTILPSHASLLARQVRLIVTPATTTLFESRALLSEIQSRFGTISTFINQRNDPVLRRLLTSESPSTPPASRSSFQTILAVFESPASQRSALDSGPLTISCGGELLPSAKELDPYNARGLHDRHHPPKRKFTCHIREENDNDGTTIHRRLREHHPYHGPFRIDTLQMCYRDLVKSGASLNEMADVMQTEQALTDRKQQKGKGWGEEGSQTTSSTGFYSNHSRLRDPQQTGGLMSAWRWATEKNKAEQEPQVWSGRASERC